MTNNQELTKKLITIFLVAAMAVSSSVLIFSRDENRSSSAAKTPSKNIKNEKRSLGNAFVEPLPRSDFNYFNYSFAENTPESKSLKQETASSSKNLTESLVQALAGQVFAINSGDPQNLEKFFDEKSIKTSLKNIEEFSIESIRISISDKEIKIAQKYNQTDIQEYFQKFAQIVDELNESLISANKNDFNSQGTLNQEELNSEILKFKQIAAAFEKATAATRNLTVPLPLVNLHKSFLKHAKNFQNLIEVTLDYRNDPVKSLLVIENNQSLKSIERDIEDLEKEFNKVLKSGLSSNLLLFNIVLGIKTANAITDFANLAAKIVHTVNHILQNVKDWWVDYIKPVLLDMIKNVVIHRLVQQVIAWVQGGGKPQFITNWRSFAKETVGSAIVYELEKTIPEICSPFRDVVNISLQKIYLSDQNPSCKLEQVISNFNQLYDRFENGSWAGFSYSILPSGNFLGSLVSASERIREAADEAQKNKEKEAETNKGFLDKVTRICSEPEEVDVGAATLEDAELIKENPDYVPGSFKCPDPVSDCKAKVCPPDKWEQTTPGGFIADTLTHAMGKTPFNQILAAEDFKALITAVVNTALSKLITGALGAMKSGGGTGGATAKGISNSSEGFEGESTGSLCDSSDSQCNDELNQLGEIANDHDPTQGNKQEVIEEAQKIKEANEKLKAAAEQTLALASTTLQKLEEVSQTCASSSAAERINNYIETVKETSQSLEENIKKAEQNIQKLEEFIKEVEALDESNEKNKFKLTKKKEELYEKFGTRDSIMAKKEAIIAIQENLNQMQEEAKKIEENNCSLPSS